MTAQTISQEGKKFIKLKEGLVLHVYPDQAGYATIGYGHLITPAEKQAKRFTRDLTQAEAEAIFEEDLARIQSEMRPLIHVKLTQHQWDALTSFTFNLGSPNLGVSSLLKKLNAGDFVGAYHEFEHWDKVRDPHTHALVSDPGLLKRRREEAAMFLG